MTASFPVPWWARNPHVQTLWGRFMRRPIPRVRHEQRDTSDGDVLDLFRIPGHPGAPRFVLLHGLEGGLHSHYVRGLLAEASARGWDATFITFRSCGPELNRLPRFYHSGDTGDVRLVLQELAAADPKSPLVAVGVSMGGNVLLRFLAEEQESSPLAAAVAVSVPYDLALSAESINRGFCRVYQRHFLRSLKRKALEKTHRFPGYVDRRRLEAARTMYQFDDVVTAPLHGFANAADYYARASSLPVLNRIRTPTLLIHAEDDPFLPRRVVDEVRMVAARNPSLEVWIVPHGGHVGFVSGSPFRPVYEAERRSIEFLARHITERVERESEKTLIGQHS